MDGRSIWGGRASILLSLDGRDKSEGESMAITTKLDWRVTPLIARKRHGWRMLSITEHFDYMFGEAFCYLIVAGNWLRHFCPGVLIPVVFGAVAEQNTTSATDLLDERFPPHFTASSPILRTCGILPVFISW
jgi:hypothetical protein